MAEVESKKILQSRKIKKHKKDEAEIFSKVRQRIYGKGANSSFLDENYFESNSNSDLEDFKLWIVKLCKWIYLFYRNLG